LGSIFFVIDDVESREEQGTSLISASNTQTLSHCHCHDEERLNEWLVCWETSVSTQDICEVYNG